MNLAKKEIEALLGPDSDTAPPEGLSERIKGEIPAPSALRVGEATPAISVVSPWRRVLWAAALLVLIASAALLVPAPRRRQRSSPTAPSTAVQAPRQEASSIESKQVAVAPVGPAATRQARGAASAEPAAVEALVTDRQGGRLPGVTVRLQGEGIERSVTSDASGKVLFKNLPAGSYVLDGRLAGFDSKISKVEVAGGTRRDVPLSLEPAVAEETITVSGGAPVAAGGVAGGAPGYILDGLNANAAASGPPPKASLNRSALSSLRAYAGSPSLPAPSTGGTAEPNDAPYGDVFFKSYGVNPFIDTEDDRLSTFGLDVDTGSYTIVRRYVQDGGLPPPEAVRVEELINYFRYGDPPPRQGDFAIRAEGAPSPFAGGSRYRLIRFGIRGRTIEAKDRKPAVLTFVVDVSGSMNYESRLELVKKALFLLLDELRPSDEVGLVVFGDRARRILDHTSDMRRLRRAIEGLSPEGSTNTEEGLLEGYALASDGHRRDAINRVLLCSDGVANVGRTGPESILSVIERSAKEGIELTTVGFGMGNYNDVLMEQLANKGDGSYAYVDTLEEARRVFVENLTGTLQTIAADAKAQVEFHPETVARYRLLGYENRDIADEKFRDDAVDAGEVGAGHSVTALYEIKLQPQASPGDRVATLRLRYRSKETGKIVETEHPLRLAELAESWEKAPRAVRLASLVAEYGEILKGSYWAKDGEMEEVFRRAQALSAELAGDARVAEFVSLAGKAAELRSRERTEKATSERNKKE